MLFVGRAAAQPPKRFHEGPYLQFTAGAMESKNDTIMRTGQTVGHDAEPAFGFIFGWNVSDPAAVEITGRYATAATFGARQHLMRANINFRWNWITDALTQYRSLRLLPFLHAGPLLDITVLPGDPAAPDPTVLQWGGGGSIGGGVSALFKEYIYLTASGQADLIGRTSVTQSIGGAPTLIYSSGWSTGWSAMLGIGVHY